MSWAIKGRKYNSNLKTNNSINYYSSLVERISSSPVGRKSELIINSLTIKKIRSGV